MGNNQYETSLLAVRGRVALDRAELCLYLVRGRSRFTLPRLALLALLGRLKQEREFRTLCLSEFRVESRRRRLHIAVDGEVFTVAPPLEYRIRPGALCVMAPR